MTSARRALALLVVALAALAAAPAVAAMRIHIDLSAQRLEATTPSGETATWKISSGRKGYETPTGRYSVMRLEADHHSDEYDQAPMPFSIFFSPRGLAIHGSYERGLGRPASHGCVRLAVPHARQLFDWVERHGGATIEITGGGASSTARRDAERPRPTRRRAVIPLDASPAPDPEIESAYRFYRY